MTHFNLPLCLKSNTFQSGNKILYAMGYQKRNFRYCWLSLVLIVMAQFVFGTVYTSSQTGNFDLPATWGGSGPPGITDSIIISSGHAITLVAPTQLASVTINNGGGVLDNAGFDLTLTEAVADSGFTFTINGTYSGSGATVFAGTTSYIGNIISGTGTVSTTGLWTISSGGVNFDAGTNLNFSGSSSMSVNSTSYIFGIVTLASGNITIATGMALRIDAAPAYLTLTNGSITQNGSLICTSGGNILLSNGSITVNTGQSLSVHANGNLTLINGHLNLVSSGTVNNNGTITVGGDITGTTASSKFNNTASGTLNIGGALLNTGVVQSFLAGNTINYNGSGAQNIKKPFSIYSHLKCSNSGTKTLTGVTTVNGNLTIQDDAQLDVASYNLTLKGNWNNTGTNLNPFIEQTGTVNLNGASAQTTGGELTFVWLRALMIILPKKFSNNFSTSLGEPLFLRKLAVDLHKLGSITSLPNS